MNEMKKKWVETRASECSFKFGTKFLLRQPSYWKQQKKVEYQITFGDCNS